MLTIAGGIIIAFLVLSFLPEILRSLGDLVGALCAIFIVYAIAASFNTANAGTIDEYKKSCTDYGFKPGTSNHAKCVMEMDFRNRKVAQPPTSAQPKPRPGQISTPADQVRAGCLRGGHKPGTDDFNYCVSIMNEMNARQVKAANLSTLEAEQRARDEEIRTTQRAKDEANKATQRAMDKDAANQAAKRTMDAAECQAYAMQAISLPELSSPTIYPAQQYVNRLFDPVGSTAQGQAIANDIFDRQRRVDAYDAAVRARTQLADACMIRRGWVEDYTDSKR